MEHGHLLPQRSLVNRVQMHGVSNRDTHFVPLLYNSSVHLTIIRQVRWNAERLECTTKLRAFIPDPLSWNGTAKNSVQSCSWNVAPEVMTLSETKLIKFSLMLSTSFQLFENERNSQTYIR